MEYIHYWCLHNRKEYHDNIYRKFPLYERCTLCNKNNIKCDVKINSNISIKLCNLHHIGIINNCKYKNIILHLILNNVNHLTFYTNNISICSVKNIHKINSITILNVYSSNKFNIFRGLNNIKLLNIYGGYIKFGIKYTKFIDNNKYICITAINYCNSMM